ncbi:MULTISPECIES: V-type ATPase subunit [Anaerotruncus]|jgi:V/A-type H+-transporting ATPase subunit C|uniref:V-type ATPase subunit n=1 Tax=Anaerotruncus TaxID=244127 RepID=UPI00082D91FE|nr:MULTISPECIES: V-type ATPase subunit [Anaerotruncus]RGX53590.1 V-type ATP synthase subunit C [Anaerotruncus sp. AF02-27]
MSSDLSYIYAVARIRSNELTLFSSQTIEQLLATKSYSECMRLLMDKGWGDLAVANPTAEELLAMEREKTWEVIREVVDDMSVFDVFLYANDYHNLKAAIKQVCTGDEDFGIYMKNGTVDVDLILTCLRDRNFAMLPEGMRAAAEEGYNALARTHDGQLCDIIIDRAALEAIYKAGKDSENELIRKYAEMTVVAADVKIAVRCHRTGKPLEFIRRALCPCDSLDVTRLARAAMEGVDSIGNCLSSTEFAAGAPILEQSSAAFERYCDNAIIEMIQSQQYVAHGVGPLAAYILGRENEIKTVRIILSGKLNGLPDSVVRERVRDMYV